MVRFGARFRGLVAFVVLGWGLTLALGACHRKAQRLEVAVTIFPLFDLTRRVAGPDADVALLVPAGVAPDLFQLGADGQAVLARSQILVAVGAGFDAWAESAAQQVAPNAEPKSRLRTLRVVDRVPTRAASNPASPEALDPHVWLDPQRGELLAKVLAEELSRRDPSHASSYRARAGALEEELRRLDEELESTMRPLRGRTLVVVGSERPAYGYFAERFGLSLVGTPPLEQAGDALKALGAAHPSAIFCVEAGASTAIKGAIAARIGADPAVLEPLGGGSGTDTYEKLVRFDAEALVATAARIPPAHESATPTR